MLICRLKMNLPNKARFIFKSIANLLVCVFLWQQVSWAGASELLTTQNIIPQPAGVTSNKLQSSQAAAQSTTDMGNAIEQFSTTNATIVPASTTASSVIYSYYPSGRMASKTLTTADSSGMVYYHYMDEDWNNQGYGRVDKSKRKTSLNKELSYTYSYYADSTGRLQAKNAYPDASWTKLIVTYNYYNDPTNYLQSKIDSTGTATYYNDSTNRMESKILSLPDKQGNIYYHYLNENWNKQGYGRTDKTIRQTALNGELSTTYTYYADSTGRVQTKNAYSDSGWTTLIAAYTYYNDSKGRIQSKFDPTTGITTTYYNDSTGRIQSKIDSTGTATYYNDSKNRMESKTLILPDSQGNVYYHYINENWNNQGYGRVDKSKRQTIFDGELAYTANGILVYSGELSYSYTYCNDTTGRLKTKMAYSDSNWTTIVGTYNYYNDATNRVMSKIDPAKGITYTYYNDAAGCIESKTLSSPDSYGYIYYHYINENWNNRGYGRIDKATRKSSVNGELSYSYSYYNDSTGRLQTEKAYSDKNGTKLVNTYNYYNDTTNRVMSRIETATSMIYTYYNDDSGRTESKTLTSPDSSGDIYYHYINENWKNRGYGRIDKTIRQSSVDGELSYSYSYSDDAAGNPQAIEAYSDKNWTILVSIYDSTGKVATKIDTANGITYTYYASGQIESVTSSVPEYPWPFTPEFWNNIYYHFDNGYYNIEGYHNLVDVARRVSGEIYLYQYDDQGNPQSVTMVSTSDISTNYVITQWEYKDYVIDVIAGKVYGYPHFECQAIRTDNNMLALINIPIKYYGNATQSRSGLQQQISSSNNLNGHLPPASNSQQQIDNLNQYPDWYNGTLIDLSMFKNFNEFKKALQDMYGTDPEKLKKISDSVESLSKFLGDKNPPISINSDIFGGVTIPGTTPDGARIEISSYSGEPFFSNIGIPSLLGVYNGSNGYVQGYISVKWHYSRSKFNNSHRTNSI